MSLRILFCELVRGEILQKLPYYGVAFQDGRHIIPGDRREEDKGDDLKYYGGVTNPTVHIALNQIRNVVNELIDIYGHPVSMSIELARDLPEGQEGRNKIEKEQKENQDRNEKIDEELKEFGQRINSDNRLRVQLWYELDENDPNGRCCPFTGKKIGKSDIFSSEFEVEHLIPFSRSLDNSRANKTLCSREANRAKKSMTPYEAFGDSPNGYNWDEIFTRVQRLPHQKRWRFQEDAWEIWTKENEDFTSRHLNDTRYIGRLTKEYLENICPHNKVNVLTGRLTSLLRRHWGLNSVLPNLESEGEEAEKKKNRDDHRHHAVDAIVVAMTNRSMLQKVSTEAGRGGKIELDRLFPKVKSGKGPIDPWDGFRQEAIDIIREIIVSHKVKNQYLNKGTTNRSLHEEMAYGIISGPDKNGKYEVVQRKPISDFDTKKKLQKIRDSRLGIEFIQAFSKDGKEGVIELANIKKIKSLRIVDKKNVIPIKDKYGKEYKGYISGRYWGVEVYEYPDGHEDSGKWHWEVISTFEAHQKGFQAGETKKPHPAAKLIMRLHINNLVEIEDDNKKRIMRIQKMSLRQIFMAEHNEANVANRNADEDMFKYTSVSSAKRLKSLNARKMHISLTGKLNYEKRHLQE